MSETQYLEFVSKFINVDLSTFMNKDLAITCFKDQIQYAEQINSLIFETFLSFSIENINQILSLNSIDQNTFYQCISVLEEAINNYSVIDVNNANLIVNQVKEKTNLKGKPLFMSIRLIVIGKEHGPEMYKILTVIGKEKIIKNIKEYRASII
jgi:lysyl-tRNA synthetase class I